jgi:CRISPR-associated protein Csd2
MKSESSVPKTTVKPILSRYDFVYLFDVADGNPNGDPDSGNLPRIDPQTFQGLVTDGAQKRKIRDYVIAAKSRPDGGNEPGYAIYFQTKGAPEQRVLNAIHAEAYKAIKKDPKDKKYEDQAAARRWMCQNFYDVRTFGAVMSTDTNCGQVRGPVQLTFARSYDSIVQQEVTISRKSVTTEEDAKKQIAKHGELTGTLGRKSVVPYGLYCAQGFISANEAAQTGFSDEDLALLWKALCGRSQPGDPEEETMFGQDHSASKGRVAARALIVFKHESKLGNAPAHRLFEALEVKLTEECEKRGGVPRSIRDYKFVLHRDRIPSSVKVIPLLEPAWS